MQGLLGESQRDAAAASGGKATHAALMDAHVAQWETWEPVLSPLVQVARHQVQTIGKACGVNKHVLHALCTWGAVRLLPARDGSSVVMQAAAWAMESVPAPDSKSPTPLLKQWRDAVKLYNLKAPDAPAGANGCVACPTSEQCISALWCVPGPCFGKNASANQRQRLQVLGDIAEKHRAQCRDTPVVASHPRVCPQWTPDAMGSIQDWVDWHTVRVFVDAGSRQRSTNVPETVARGTARSMLRSMTHLQGMGGCVRSTPLHARGSTGSAEPPGVLLWVQVSPPVRSSQCVPPPSPPLKKDTTSGAQGAQLQRTPLRAQPASGVTGESATRSPFMSPFTQAMHQRAQKVADHLRQQAAALPPHIASTPETPPREGYAPGTEEALQHAMQSVWTEWQQWCTLVHSVQYGTGEHAVRCGAGPRPLDFPSMPPGTLRCLVPNHVATAVAVRGGWAIPALLAVCASHPRQWGSMHKDVSHWAFQQACGEAGASLPAWSESCSVLQGVMDEACGVTKVEPRVQKPGTQYESRESNGGTAVGDKHTAAVQCMEAAAQHAALRKGGEHGGEGEWDALSTLPMGTLLAASGVKRVLMAHQLRALRTVFCGEVCKHTGGWLAMEMGTGKTTVAVAAAAMERALHALRVAHRTASGRESAASEHDVERARMMQAHMQAGHLSQEEINAQHAAAANRACAATLHTAFQGRSAPTVAGDAQESLRDAVQGMVGEFRRQWVHWKLWVGACMSSRLVTTRAAPLHSANDIDRAQEEAVCSLNAYLKEVNHFASLHAGQQCQALLLDAVAVDRDAWGVFNRHHILQCVVHVMSTSLDKLLREAQRVVSSKAAIAQAVRSAESAHPRVARGAAEVLGRCVHAWEAPPPLLQKVAALTHTSMHGVDTPLWTASNAMRDALHSSAPRPTLALVPSALVGVWQDEVRDTLHAHAASPRVCASTGELVECVHQWLKNPMQPCSLFIVAESLLTPGSDCSVLTNGVASSVAALALIPWARVFVDEGHSLSSVGSVRHKNMAQLLQSARSAVRAVHPSATIPLWLMTGTPVRNGISDLHAQGSLMEASLPVRCPGMPRDAVAWYTVPGSPMVCPVEDWVAFDSSCASHAAGVPSFLAHTIAHAPKSALPTVLNPKRVGFVPVVMQPECAAVHRSVTQTLGKVRVEERARDGGVARVATENRLNRMESVAHGSDALWSLQTACAGAGKASDGDAARAAIANGARRHLVKHGTLGGKLYALQRIVRSAWLAGRSVVVFVKRHSTQVACEVELGALASNMSSVGGGQVVGALDDPASGMHRVGWEGRVRGEDVGGPNSGARGVAAMHPEVLRINGNTSMVHREMAVRAVNRKDANSPVALVATMRTTGTGLRLHGASVVVFVESDYCPAMHAQAEDRVHRPKQEHGVVDVVYLYACVPESQEEGSPVCASVDAAIAHLRAQKQQTSDSLMQASHVVGWNGNPECVHTGPGTQAVGRVLPCSGCGAACASPGKEGAPPTEHAVVGEWSGWSKAETKGLKRAATVGALHAAQVAEAVQLGRAASSALPPVNPSTVWGEKHVAAYEGLLSRNAPPSDSDAVHEAVPEMWRHAASFLQPLTVSGTAAEVCVAMYHAAASHSAVAPSGKAWQWAALASVSGTVAMTLAVAQKHKAYSQRHAAIGADMRAAFSKAFAVMRVVQARAVLGPVHVLSRRNAGGASPPKALKAYYSAMDNCIGQRASRLDALGRHVAQTVLRTPDQHMWGDLPAQGSSMLQTAATHGMQAQAVMPPGGRKDDLETVGSDTCAVLPQLKALSDAVPGARKQRSPASRGDAGVASGAPLDATMQPSMSHSDGRAAMNSVEETEDGAATGGSVLSSARQVMSVMQSILPPPVQVPTPPPTSDAVRGRSVLRDVQRAFDKHVSGEDCPVAWDSVWAVNAPRSLGTLVQWSEGGASDDEVSVALQGDIRAVKRVMGTLARCAGKTLQLAPGPGSRDGKHEVLASACVECVEAAKRDAQWGAVLTAVRYGDTDVGKMVEQACAWRGVRTGVSGGNSSRWTHDAVVRCAAMVHTKASSAESMLRDAAKLHRHLGRLFPGHNAARAGAGSKQKLARVQ